MGKLFDRIKETIQRLTPARFSDDVTPETVVPGDEHIKNIEEPVEVTRDQSDFIPQARMAAAIRKAGRAKVMLYLKYNDNWRYVEPYSFRNGKHGLLFFGHCVLHDRTHSFYVHRIQGMQISSAPFVARWKIELD